MGHLTTDFACVCRFIGNWAWGFQFLGKTFGRPLWNIPYTFIQGILVLIYPIYKVYSSVYNTYKVNSSYFTIYKISLSWYIIYPRWGFLQISSHIIKGPLVLIYKIQGILVHIPYTKYTCPDIPYTKYTNLIYHIQGILVLIYHIQGMLVLIYHIQGILVLIYHIQGMLVLICSSQTGPTLIILRFLSRPPRLSSSVTLP